MGAGGGIADLERIARACPPPGAAAPRLGPSRWEGDGVMRSREKRPETAARIGARSASSGSARRGGDSGAGGGGGRGGGGGGEGGRRRRPRGRRGGSSSARGQ